MPATVQEHIPTHISPHYTTRYVSKQGDTSPTAPWLSFQTRRWKTRQSACGAAGAVTPGRHLTLLASAKEPGRVKTDLAMGQNSTTRIWHAGLSPCFPSTRASLFGCLCYLKITNFCSIEGNLLDVNANCAHSERQGLKARSATKPRQKRTLAEAFLSLSKPKTAGQNPSACAPFFWKTLNI